MLYIEAVQNIAIPNGMPSLFLAGGITGCPDWQADMVSRLGDLDIALINPRRANFPIDDPNAARQQIEWEHRGLGMADAISFWFPCETLCPITLYELGAWTARSSMSLARMGVTGWAPQKPIFVGVHPDYKRRLDVEIQTELAKPYPSSMVSPSIDDLCRRVREWFTYQETY